MPGVIRPSVDPLDTLEAQIRDLESKIIGQPSEGEGAVAESLSRTNAAITSAVSNYDAIKTIFDRINQLDSYLDPTYEDFLTDATIKTKVILESEADLKELLTQLVRLNEINDSLDGGHLTEVPQLKDRLKAVTETAVKNQELCASVRDKVNDLMVSYNSVINNMTRAFAQFDAIVTQLENEAKPKKQLD
ncbi:hypothetical protein AAG570_002820 [Ranatra chinensis]|uniref:Dynactin subunit 3 n=1 Tax=Ranatra chinensis TaxID=642074 RepID=A0ABD0YTG1_9HEMI